MNRKPAGPAATLEEKTYEYAIRSAFRQSGLFLRARSENKVVGLRIPRDAECKPYIDAMRAALKSSKSLDHYHVASVVLSRKGETLSEDAIDAIKLRSAVVVLIEHGTVVPFELQVAIDRTVDVDPVRPFHLISAAKEAWQMQITRDQAISLAQHPPRLLFAALRQGRSIDAVTAKLASASSTGRSRKWEPRLEELEGYGEAMVWGENLVSDIAEWRTGRIAWRDVDCGLLLSGPPGTGKTLFASALARSCGAHFIGTSSAQWQAKGHLGDMLGAMRKSFRDARDNAPSVLFIDEIDAIGDRRTFTGDYVSYSVQVVNALLELLDGTDEREGVIVVAASNFPQNLDPALKRPGRLDRHIVIELPDQVARAQMIATHLGVTSAATEALHEAARTMSGYTGALIAQVAKDARRIARKQGRAVEISDLQALVPPLAAVVDVERWESCVHEAGHAVVGLELGVGDLEFIVVARQLGHRDHRAGHVQWKRRVTMNRRKQSYIDEVTMLLAGLAAERVILGDILDGAGGSEGSDLQRASDLVTLMVSNLGLGSLHYLEVATSKDLDDLRRNDPAVREKVEELLSGYLSRAEEIILARRSDVELLASTLMDRELIPGQDVLQLVGQSSGDRGAV